MSRTTATQSTPPAAALTSRQAAALSGAWRVPGDKSISHRALMLGALAVGETHVSGLLEGEDVLRTAAAMRALGAKIEAEGSGPARRWKVRGVGVGGLSEPGDVLDMGNSGTGARLLMGIVATHNFTSFFTGDSSLRRRPMGRVTEPLSRMGARLIGREGNRLPMAVVGAPSPMPIAYRLPVASAQVKSAILLAGLNTPGRTVVIEPEPTRDHSENLLRHFGAEVKVEHGPKGERTISLTGEPELIARPIAVPGDPSSAAFAAVAAAVVPGSSITLQRIGANVLRTGLFETLVEMGADLNWTNQRLDGGEPVADLVVRHRPLKGVSVPPERAPTMIDEYPILCVAAAMAQGETRIQGAAELRVKESDRIAAMARGLLACGVAVEELPDGMIVRGGGGRAPAGGALIATQMDHRIAMSFLVLGCVSAAPIAIDDAAMIDTSFPGFVELMNGMGARIGAGGGQA
jgi:3-phosphoshikimate 1-carboxyvinyltransferase